MCVFSGSWREFWILENIVVLQTDDMWPSKACQWKVNLSTFFFFFLTNLNQCGKFILDQCFVSHSCSSFDLSWIYCYHWAMMQVCRRCKYSSRSCISVRKTRPFRYLTLTLFVSGCVASQPVWELCSMTALTLSSASTAHRHAVVHRNVSAFYKESYITKTNIVLVEIHRALVVSFPRAPFVSTASSCCIILAVLPRRQVFFFPTSPNGCCLLQIQEQAEECSCAGKNLLTLSQHAHTAAP